MYKAFQNRASAFVPARAYPFKVYFGETENLRAAYSRTFIVFLVVWQMAGLTGFAQVDDMFTPLPAHAIKFGMNNGLNKFKKLER